MRLVVSDHDLNLGHSTKQLLRRTLGPLCGLQQHASFLLRGRYNPRVAVCGVELTGVHVLQGRPKPPGVSPYHIGGAGITSHEALIRAIGETLERYSQLVFERSGRHEITFATYDEMRTHNKTTVPLDAVKMFTDQQYQHAQFPFHPITAKTTLGWTTARSLITGSSIEVPAQLVFVGYAAQEDRGETRFAPAVTTGSASHTDPILAARNAILELIQLDSAIGHWYSKTLAYRIEFDSRTEVVTRVLERHLHPLGPRPEFFWLPNADLPGFTVACLLWAGRESFPRVAIGLGSELCLEATMYKALLEAVGVLGLSKVTLLEASIDSDNDTWRQPSFARDNMFDLDSNILYYALPSNVSTIEGKFSATNSVRARDIPRDISVAPQDEVRLLVNAFKETGKELVHLDLTTSDIRDLGFTALRVWSPHTLSLSLPSAAPLAHPRLEAYGGPVDAGPHPYA